MKLLEHVKKAMELVEFFEKHPELFSKMKDMAEVKSSDFVLKSMALAVIMAATEPE